MSKNAFNLTKNLAIYYHDDQKYLKIKQKIDMESEKKGHSHTFHEKIRQKNFLTRYFSRNFPSAIVSSFKVLKKDLECYWLFVHLSMCFKIISHNKACSIALLECYFQTPLLSHYCIPFEFQSMSWNIISGETQINLKKKRYAL